MTHINPIDQKKEQYIHFKSHQGGFPDSFLKEYSLKEIRNKSIDEKNISTAGRILTIRAMGKLIFAKLYDATASLQISFEKEILGKESFQNLKTHLARGDHIGVKGKLYFTKKEELTLSVQEYQILNKSIRSLPEKYHGIKDREFAYRHRYLDLIFNEDSRELALKRIRLVQEMRRFLESKGFLECETPILQTQVSGAMAKPFFSYHESLNLNCNLRIACETYLKRCVAGGLDRVYEFSRCFRNEGLSTQHLQEFTMLEFYIAYFNYQDLKKFTKDFLRTSLEKTFGTLKFSLGDHILDFEAPIPSYSYSEMIQKFLGLDLTNIRYQSREGIETFIKDKNLEVKDPNVSLPNLVDQIYKKYVRPHLKGPLFLEDYPINQLPLARPSQSNSQVAHAFQLIIAGQELVKAYSELVDPIDQREKLIQQAKAKAAGDEEAMSADEEFLEALEYGLPPTAGFGLGIDRFIALLFNTSSIKDAVLFPLMKPEEK